MDCLIKKCETNYASFYHFDNPFEETILNQALKKNDFSLDLSFSLPFEEQFDKLTKLFSENDELLAGLIEDLKKLLINTDPNLTELTEIDKKICIEIIFIENSVKYNIKLYTDAVNALLGASEIKINQEKGISQNLVRIKRQLLDSKIAFDDFGDKKSILMLAFTKLLSLNKNLSFGIVQYIEGNKLEAHKIDFIFGKNKIIPEKKWEKAHVKEVKEIEKILGSKSNNKKRKRSLTSEEGSREDDDDEYDREDIEMDSESDASDTEASDGGYEEELEKRERKKYDAFLNQTLGTPSSFDFNQTIKKEKSNKNTKRKRTDKGYKKEEEITTPLIFKTSPDEVLKQTFSVKKEESAVNVTEIPQSTTQFEVKSVKKEDPITTFVKSSKNGKSKKNTIKTEEFKTETVIENLVLPDLVSSKTVPGTQFVKLEDVEDYEMETEITKLDPLQSNSGTKMKGNRVGKKIKGLEGLKKSKLRKFQILKPTFFQDKNRFGQPIMNNLKTLYTDLEVVIKEEEEVEPDEKYDFKRESFKTEQDFEEVRSGANVPVQGNPFKPVQVPIIPEEEEKPKIDMETDDDIIEIVYENIKTQGIKIKEENPELIQEIKNNTFVQIVDLGKLKEIKAVLQDPIIDKIYAERVGLQSKNLVVATEKLISDPSITESERVEAEKFIKTMDFHELETLNETININDPLKTFVNERINLFKDETIDLIKNPEMLSDLILNDKLTDEGKKTLFRSLLEHSYPEINIYFLFYVPDNPDFIKIVRDNFKNFILKIQINVPVFDINDNILIAARHRDLHFMLVILKYYNDINSNQLIKLQEKIQKSALERDSNLSRLLNSLPVSQTVEQLSANLQSLFSYFSVEKSTPQGMHLDIVFSLISYLRALRKNFAELSINSLVTIILESAIELYEIQKNNEIKSLIKYYNYEQKIKTKKNKQRSTVLNTNPLNKNFYSTTIKEISSRDETFEKNLRVFEASKAAALTSRDNAFYSFIKILEAKKLNYDHEFVWESLFLGDNTHLGFLLAMYSLTVEPEFFVGNFEIQKNRMAQPDDKTIAFDKENVGIQYKRVFYSTNENDNTPSMRTYLYTLTGIYNFKQSLDKLIAVVKTYIETKTGKSNNIVIDRKLFENNVMIMDYEIVLLENEDLKIALVRNLSETFVNKTFYYLTLDEAMAGVQIKTKNNRFLNPTEPNKIWDFAKTYKDVDGDFSIGIGSDISCCIWVNNPNGVGRFVVLWINDYPQIPPENIFYPSNSYCFDGVYYPLTFSLIGREVLGPTALRPKTDGIAAQNGIADFSPGNLFSNISIQTKTASAVLMSSFIPGTSLFGYLLEIKFDVLIAAYRNVYPFIDVRIVFDRFFNVVHYIKVDDRFRVEGLQIFPSQLPNDQLIIKNLTGPIDLIIVNKGVPILQNFRTNLLLKYWMPENEDT